MGLAVNYSTRSGSLPSDLMNNMTPEPIISASGVLESPPKETNTIVPENSHPAPPSPNSRPPAVEVVNACKSYGALNSIPVLKDFNMTVGEGTIYALLGSSGCGKTTILSCIVGIRKLDSGDIFVFNERPGTKESGIPGRSVGYMPQDTALYRQLSIKEMLQYFGRIYGMTNTEIMGRIEFLSHFLDLPASSRIIGSLSGGQQRRTSLAASLLHEPSILILDEPTVGVDPLLRESIWNYLCELRTKKDTTIIITTHYIEEARYSDTVGIMRNGKMLTERVPDDLMKEYHAIFLEEVVLQLCKGDIREGGNHEDVKRTLAENSFYQYRKYLKTKTGLKSDTKPKKDKDTVIGITFKPSPTDANQNGKQEEGVQQRKKVKRTQSLKNAAWDGMHEKFGRIRAIAVRNALTLLRSPIFMLAIFFMPSFQVVITNLTLGPEPKHLAFGIVDPEVNFDLSKCDNLPDQCDTQTLSCRYIKSLPDDIIRPVAVNTVEQALDDVKTGKLWGYMSFPVNYSGHLVNRAASNIFSDNETIDGSTVSLKMDHSQYFAAALLMKSLYESFQKFVKGSLINCDQDPQKADVPLQFNRPVYGTLDITFHDYIAPAVLIVILFFIPYISCAVYNITDRKQGTLDRSMVAGIKMTDLFFGFFITEGFLIICQTMIAYLLVLYVFEMEIKGSVFGFLLFAFMTGVAGLSFGFLIAQLVEEEVEALITGVGFYLPNLIFCGIIWPLEAAPWYINFMSYCLPMTYAISGVRSIISRGWPMVHQYVWPGYAILLAWILGCGILASIAFRRRIR